MVGSSVLLPIMVVFISRNVLSLPVDGKKSAAVYPFEFVTKEEWGGKPATAVSPLNTPVPVVVIHHTYLPEACWGRQECGRAMKSMQLTHQQTNHWADIGYNFAVGGDGAVYEGRGWKAVGAHAAGNNARSIGVVLIGDWADKLPPAKQIKAAQDLIATGVRLGFVQPSYTLLGHRQLGATECPGDTLYKNLKTWGHFSDKEMRTALNKT